MVTRSSLHLSHSVEPDKHGRREAFQQETSPAAPSLSALPTEIITSILQQVGSRKDLKYVRRSCRRLGSIAAALLFEEVTTVPPEDSFEQLLKLSDHVTLSQHVKCLVYDTRTMWELEDVQMEINADPVLKLYWEVPSRRLRLRAFLKYRDEHTFRTVEQTGQELHYLWRLPESLPSLKTIQTRGVMGYDVAVAGLPRFYRRMGKHMGQHHERYFNPLKRITCRT